MKTSAGLVIIQDNKILLVHPTNAKWVNTYSIPKGEIDENEEIFDCAIRETQEELGIQLDKEKIEIKGIGHISYMKDLIEFKRVYYYACSYPEPIIIDLNNLQKDEVDWAGFLDKQEAETKLFWRQKNILHYLT